MSPQSRNGKMARSARQSGQALLEMALVTPLLLALALGVIELGRYAYFAILVGNAAHAGATYGAQGVAYSVNSAGIQDAAQGDFGGNGSLRVNSSVSCGCDSGGSVASSSCSLTTAPVCTPGHWEVTVSVTTSARFQPLFSYPGLPGSVRVNGAATMRVAQQ